MKQGLSLMELAAKIEADVERQEDLLVDTTKLSVLTTAEGGSTIHLPDGRELDMLQHTHRQIGQTLGIRADFYDRLRHSHPELHTTTVNTLLREGDSRFTPGKRMVRTYKDGGAEDRGIARAFMSDKYNRIDHHMILQGILPVIGELKDAGHQVVIPTCEVTDSKMYVKVLIPTVSFDVRDYTNKPLPGGDDQIVQLGFVFTNSEVGTGAFDIQKLLYRRVCRNGMIAGSAMSKRHVGSRVQASEDMTIYQSDTLKADAKALQLKIRDVTKALVDAAKFELLVKEFAAAAESKPMIEPMKAMEALAPVLTLTGNELTKATQHLLTGGNLTKFGAVNALTAMAQEVDSYDRSVELEELAATNVLRMNDKDWEAIATVTA